MNIEVFFKVILAVIETFLFFGIGAFLVIRKMLDGNSIKGMSRFAVNVLTPFMIFATVAGKFSRDDLRTAWVYPASGFLMVALHAVFGYLLLPLLKHRTPERKATFLHMAALNNFLFMPIIIVDSLWGGKTTAALLLWSVGSIAAQWTIGSAVMAGNDWKQMLKNLLSPNTFAVLLAALYLLQPFRMPEMAMNFISKVGALAIPMTLIFIGGSIWLARSGWGEHISDFVWATAVRIVIIPLLTLLLLKILPLPATLHNLSLVLAVMPGAAASVLIVREYGGDVKFAGQLVLSSTLFGLFTMPLLLALFL